MDYTAIKHLHTGAVALSVASFATRSLAALLGAAWVRSRPAKVLPHVIDTLLLLSALALVWQLGVNPLATPWLLAKIVGLVLYIALGVLALRPGLPRRQRILAALAALLVVGWIGSVAVLKQPLGFLQAWV